jgi:signal transduction histidine kinase
VIELALLVAVGTLIAGLALAFALRLLPSVRLRLAGVALIAVALPLCAVILSGVAMFHMGADVVILAVAAASSTVALVAALLVARSISVPIDRLRASSAALAAGELSSRATPEGPDELAELARSFNDMAEKLEGLFDARRQLVAWASHDLRTPLASMRAMLEALEDGLAEPEEYLTPLGDQVRALSGLVDDLFELARIDAGALTLELHEAALAGMVESSVRGLQAEAKARHVRLDAHLDARVGLVRCAPDKVERVLVNLLSNALRHTPSDGAVAVSAEPVADEIVVAVDDTGDGLAPEALKRMFDHFWRGDSARSAAGGGLGLAIARGLVEAQGGRIWAENRPSGGARVCFTLPAA